MNTTVRGKLQLVEYNLNLKYAISKKYVYELVNDKISRTWKILYMEDDPEGTRWKLEKGVTIFTSGFFVIDFGNGESHSYDVKN